MSVKSIVCIQMLSLGRVRDDIKTAKDATIGEHFKNREYVYTIVDPQRKCGAEVRTK
jgi:hypothetical protein